MRVVRSKEADAIARKTIHPKVLAAIPNDLLEKALSLTYRLCLANSHYVYVVWEHRTVRQAQTFSYSTHGYTGAVLKAIEWIDTLNIQIKEYLGSINRVDRPAEVPDKTVFVYRVSYFCNELHKWRSRVFSVTAYTLSIPLATHLLRTAEGWLQAHLDKDTLLKRRYRFWRKMQVYNNDAPFNWKEEYDKCN